LNRRAVERLVLADASDPGHARVSGVVEADRLRRAAGAGGDPEGEGRCRTTARGRDGGHVERITDVRLDVEVEVDTDPLEERVVETDEPDLDRHLEILEATELLEEVGMPEPRRRLAAYPHELSGGQQQRVMIAMAIACEPKLLIADEPTTALDVTIQAQILELMRDLKHRVGAAIVLITHDLGVVAEVAERVVVMYAGRKVEEAAIGPLFRTPRHPYTQGLLGSMPKLGSSLTGEETRLTEIPGLVPSLKKKLDGCVFASRCQHATDLCRAVAPALEEKAPGHVAACHYALREGALAA
jgi:peptide/nickel transport system ATP-binding protein